MKPFETARVIVRSVIVLLGIAAFQPALIGAQTLTVTFNPANFSNLQNVPEWTSSAATTVTVKNTAATGTATVQTITTTGQYTAASVPNCPSASACTLGPGVSLAFQVSIFPTVGPGSTIYGAVAVGYLNSLNKLLYVYGALPGTGSSNSTFAVSTFPTLPSANTGISYSQTLTTSNGTAPLTWRSTTLPTGFSLSGAGVLSGTPATCSTPPCTSGFTVMVQDHAGHQAHLPMTLSVYPAPPTGDAECQNIWEGVPPSGAVTPPAIVPLNDLGTANYCPNGSANCEQGGLYNSGSNTSAYQSTGVTIAKTINTTQPYALVSLGFSNPNLEFGKFAPLAKTIVNTNLAVVDAAEGSQSASCLSGRSSGGTCDGNYWNTSPASCSPITNGYVHCSLKAAGRTESQVSAIWLKATNDLPPANDFPATAQTLQCDIETIILGTAPQTFCPSNSTPFQGLGKQFPNLKAVYVSSRTYAGYANDLYNPETYSYETGFANKWAVSYIEPMVSGTVPFWVGWGPYLWTNGMIPRSDGLTWTCQDVMTSDGRHPSDPVGQMKVAVELLNFFKNDTTAIPWFF